MRTWIPGGAILLALVVPHPAFAAGKLDRWAHRYDLHGAWRAKDADRDGLKNREEYALRTNPRRADTDRDGLRDGDELRAAADPLQPDTDGDGVRDGDENAGVITAFDGTVLTVRRFHGPELDVLVDDTLCAGSDEDQGFVETTEDVSGEAPEDDAAPPDEEDTQETVVDLGGDDDYGYAGCSDPRIRPGAVVSSIELIPDDAGELIATAVNLAPTGG
ncbi:hypothetical protein [Solirubrobacter soli]|uniref:hypothetical protein n=1 Tax=Solirubrobacter soli TaxID=363832 RepID=UPI000417F9E1|nr:hypothetical protein [Solirubrobacter soli]